MEGRGVTLREVEERKREKLLERCWDKREKTKEVKLERTGENGETKGEKKVGARWR